MCIASQRICAKAKKKNQMKTFVINMIILFYFPRGFEKAYNKMYTWNED